MANCSYCDSFILFGGKTDRTGRYCNATCQQAGNLLAFSQQIPRVEMNRLITEVHESNCPRCGKHGPIDVHKAHAVWSALVLTSWSSRPALSCKSCATKRQAGAMFSSAVLGWWGFPWGLIMTPVQIVRNVFEMIEGPKPGKPTPLLEKYVRLQAAARIVQQPPPLRRTPPPIPGKASAPPPLPDNDDRYKPVAV
jgi:hypothetical protein